MCVLRELEWERPAEWQHQEHNYTNLLAICKYVCMSVCVSVSQRTHACAYKNKGLCECSYACASLCSHLSCTRVSPGEISSFKWSRHTKAAASLQAQGKTHCRRHDRCLPHTTQRLTALWARRMTAWFTANELARGETHHLQHGLVCDVPIKEDHCYKWSNLPFEKLSVWKLNFELNCLLLVLGFLFSEQLFLNCPSAKL